MNLPVTTIRHECRQVIAINVSPIHAEEKYRLNIMGVAMRTYNFMSHANIFKDIAECDLLIEPQGLDKYANTDLDKAEEIFTCGYDTACRVLFENKR